MNKIAVTQHYLDSSMYLIFQPPVPAMDQFSASDP